MKLKSYLNLYSLLQNEAPNIEKRRAFGLSNKSLKKYPIKQLLLWESAHLNDLKKPSLSDKFCTYLYRISLIFSVISFVLGIFSGIALLHYNGSEPVNVVYFIAVVVFFPVLTMLLGIFSMFRANRMQSVLVHISPAYWMEKLFAFFKERTKEKRREFKINPLLANWIVIRRSQLISIFFSLGLLSSLLLVIASRDIAFAWSTTLQISAEEFHAFLYTVAFAWRDIFPWAVPSLPLVEQSQYFRLGDRLSEDMISNASRLGEWWKFLAFSTLIYALFLRIIMYIVATIGYQYALKKSILNLEGAQSLLKNMNEPVVTTHADDLESDISGLYNNNIQYVRHLDPEYDVIQGWAIPSSTLKVVGDAVGVKSKHIFEVGGSNSISEDRRIAKDSFGKVLLYVKAWEPPTLDIIDYIEELSGYVKQLTVFPIGTEAEKYDTKMRYQKIWSQKLSLLKNRKLWLKIV